MSIQHRAPQRRSPLPNSGWEPGKIVLYRWDDGLITLVDKDFDELSEEDYEDLTKYRLDYDLDSVISD